MFYFCSAQAFRWVGEIHLGVVIKGVRLAMNELESVVLKAVDLLANVGLKSLVGSLIMFIAQKAPIESYMEGVKIK